MGGSLSLLRKKANSSKGRWQPGSWGGDEGRAGCWGSPCCFRGPCCAPFLPGGSDRGDAYGSSSFPSELGDSRLSHCSLCAASLVPGCLRAEPPRLFPFPPPSLWDAQGRESCASVPKPQLRAGYGAASSLGEEETLSSDTGGSSPLCPPGSCNRLGVSDGEGLEPPESWGGGWALPPLLHPALPPPILRTPRGPVLGLFLGIPTWGKTILQALWGWMVRDEGEDGAGNLSCSMGHRVPSAMGAPRGAVMPGDRLLSEGESNGGEE